MKLTRAQIEYTQRRIRTILAEKKKAELNALVKPTILERTMEERWKLVLSGKAKIKEDKAYLLNGHRCLDLDYFDFSPTSKKEKAAMDAYNMQLSAINQKYKELEENAMDQLMLPGAALALAESLK